MDYRFVVSFAAHTRDGDFLCDTSTSFNNLLDAVDFMKKVPYCESVQIYDSNDKLSLYLDNVTSVFQAMEHIMRHISNEKAMTEYRLSDIDLMISVLNTLSDRIVMMRGGLRNNLTPPLAVSSEGYDEDFCLVDYD